jgi:hypothetical protein
MIPVNLERDDGVGSTKNKNIIFSFKTESRRHNINALHHTSHFRQMTQQILTEGT